MSILRILRPRLGLLLPGVSALAFVLHCHEYSVVQDDAYISLAYAKHFAAGDGLVFNPGERVEGYTNFLWTLVLVVPHLLGLDAVVTAQVLSLACAISLFFVIWWIGGLFGDDRPVIWRVPAVALLAANGAWAFWTLSGLETALFVLLVTLGAGLYVRDGLAGVSARHTGAVFGLAALNRPEGILFFGLTVLHLAACQVRTQRLDVRALLAYGVPFAALVGPHFAFRLLYYGQPLPNTFYAKTGLGLTYLHDGLHYTAKFLVDYGLWGFAAVAPLVWLALARRLRDVPAYVCLLLFSNAIYVIAVGGDTMAENRLFLPIIPLLYLAIQEASIRVSRRLRPGFASPVIVAALAGVCAYTFLVSRPGLLHAQAATKAHNGKLFDLVDLLHARPDQGSLLVASTAIGIPRYFTTAEVLDLVGLTDATIAHDPEPLPGIRDDHRLHNYNTQYVMERAPDIIFFITGERPTVPAERALFLSQRFRREYYFSYFSHERPVLVRQPEQPRAPERIYPSGQFVELYARALSAQSESTSIRLLRESIGAGPADFVHAHTWLGRAAYDAGRYGEAAVAFEQALRIDGSAVMAAAHLAILRTGESRTDEAVALGEQAVSLAPGSHFCRYALGRALLAAGRHEVAIEHLLAALRLGGPPASSADAAYRMGMAYQALGDPAGARASWTAALQADPQHALVRAALAKLAGG